MPFSPLGKGFLTGKIDATTKFVMAEPGIALPLPPKSATATWTRASAGRKFQRTLNARRLLNGAAATWQPAE